MRNSCTYFQWLILSPSSVVEKQNGNQHEAFRIPLCLCLFPQKGAFLFLPHITKDPGPWLRLLDANEIQTTRGAAREEICIRKQRHIAHKILQCLP